MMCVLLVAKPPPNKVEQVMRAEMKRLRTCFSGALGSLGGLDALAEADSRAAAAAIDNKISK